MRVYLSKVDAALRGMTVEDFILSVATPFSGNTNQALVRIEPVGGTHRPWSKARTEFASDYIARRVFEWARCRKTTELSPLIMELLQNPNVGVRKYGAALWEQAVHNRFRAGIRLRAERITEVAPPLVIDILRADGGEDNCLYTLPV